MEQTNEAGIVYLLQLVGSVIDNNHGMQIGSSAKIGSVCREFGVLLNSFVLLSLGMIHRGKAGT